MNKPFLTPENIMLPKHQVESNSWGSSKCLDLHMEINSYVEFLCGNDGCDAGGHYANWLNSIGFQHQTDDGWWNATAADLENIELFAKWYKWDGELIDLQLMKIKRRIEVFEEFKSMRGARVELIDRHSKVSDYL